MGLTTEKALNNYYNLHSAIYHLNNDMAENIIMPEPFMVDNSIDKKHLSKMFHIENTYSNEHMTHPFGIISSMPSYYRNNLILSLIHPNNKWLSPLYNSIDNRNLFVSKWSYINQTIDDSNTLKTTVIVTPVQSIISWLECIKDLSMNVKIISSNKELKNMDNTNYDLIIVTTNMWNNFVINPLIHDKYISRLILDDIHLFSVSNSKYIKFKFIWIVSEYLEDLLHYYWDNHLWDANFANNCISIFNKKEQFQTMIEESKQFDYSHMTDDYINNIADDRELIKFNISYILKNYTVWNIDRYYNTPFNIYKYSRNQIKSFKPYRVKRGFFNDLLNGFTQTCFDSNISNHIISFKNYKYSATFDINVELVSCIMEFSPESVDRFINSDLRIILDGSIGLLNKYFDCYNDIVSLKQNIDYLNIDERLEHNLGCPICYESINTDIIITGCCKHVFHHGCLLNCFKNNILCPMCRSIIPMNKSYVVNEYFRNVTKMPTQLQVITNLLKSENTKRVLIIDSVHYINILTYKIRTMTQGRIEAYLLSENVKENLKLYNAINSDNKVVMICMKNYIDKYKSLDLGEIDTLILYNNDSSIVSELLPQLMSSKRKVALNIYYLNIDGNQI
jgi:hypothetical protein